MNYKRIFFHAACLACCIWTAHYSLWALIPLCIKSILEWEDGLGRMGKKWLGHAYNEYSEDKKNG